MNFYYNNLDNIIPEHLSSGESAVRIVCEDVSTYLVGGDYRYEHRLWITTGIWHLGDPSHTE